MAATTRHLRRENLAAAANPATNEEPLLPRALGDRAQPNNQRRMSTAAAVDGPSDEQSEISRFLLVGNGQRPRGCFSRFRRDNADGRMRGMGTFKTDAFSLALEPIEIGSEKVVMLSEAYAIFGGLFLNGTWVLHEWGNASENADDAPEYQKRYFAAIMALAICSNIFLALWSSILWIMAIVYGSREGFVFQARKLLGFCNALLWLTLVFVTFGVFGAMALNLGSNLLKLIIVVVIAAHLSWTGIDLVNDLEFSVSPLSCYHQPAWWRAIGHPMAVFTYSGRKKLQERAKAEAEKLNCRAYGNKSDEDDETDSSMDILLRTAASNLGRNDDVATYVTRLKEDWFNDADQLKHRSAEFLSRYMPFLLAEEVQKLAEAEYSG